VNRGDVWWVDVEPLANSGEAKERRLVVIVSNDASNQSLSRVQVVPLTSRIERLYPCEAYVTVKGKQRKAMADQLTTVSKSSLSDRLSALESADMAKVERAIRVQLALD